MACNRQKKLRRLCGQAPGSLAAAKAAGAALPPTLAESITARACRTDLPKLLGQGVEGSAVQRCREVAEEVTMEPGDTLILWALPPPAPAPS